MTTKKRRKLMALCLSLVMLFSIIPLWVTLVQPVKAVGYGISNPRTDKNGVSTWDCVYFGNYYQSNSTTKEPIKWRVLSVNGDDAFLLADQNLDAQPYNTEYVDVTWETCTLRTWLNNDFYNTAFSAEEKSAIKTTLVVNEDNPNPYLGTEGGNDTNDKLYLLSIQEVINPIYGFSSEYDELETRKAKCTEYTVVKGVTCYREQYSDWWLRTPASRLNIASYVSRIGRVIEEDAAHVDSDVTTVRPALHLNLSSNKWSKAGTVSSDGKESVIPYKPTTTVKPTQTSKPKSVAKPTKISAPGKVTKLTAKNKKKRSVTLSWKKVSRAKGYQIQYASNKKFSKKKKSKLTTKTKFTAKKLKRKKTYYFRVRAYKLNGKKKVYGKWSEVKKVKIKK